MVFRHHLLWYDILYHHHCHPTKLLLVSETHLRARWLAISRLTYNRLWNVVWKLFAHICSARRIDEWSRYWWVCVTLWQVVCPLHFVAGWYPSQDQFPWPRNTTSGHLPSSLPSASALGCLKQGHLCGQWVWAFAAIVAASVGTAI